MLDDEIGMHILDVKKHIYIIESKLSKEDKLYEELLRIHTNAKSAYKTNNAKIINNKNNSIALSVETKKANLKSYKKYVEKMMFEYQNTTISSIDILQKGVRKMD